MSDRWEGGEVDETDQARAMRVVLAILTDDFDQLASVSVEGALDPRGSAAALWQLVIALGATVAEVWGPEGVEIAVDGIRRGLLELQERNGRHG